MDKRQLDLQKCQTKLQIENGRYLKTAEELKKAEAENQKHKKTNKEQQAKITSMKETNEELTDKCEVIQEEYEKLKNQLENTNYMKDHLA